MIQTNITLRERCLLLTAEFETGLGPPECYGRVAGNGDGQGISFGVLQLNLGAGTLQPMLAHLMKEHRADLASIFMDKMPILALMSGEKRASMAAAVGIQAKSTLPSGKVKWALPQDWIDAFAELGKLRACQKLQIEAAGGYWRRALQLAREYGLTSELGIAFMFDLAVQNWGIPTDVQDEIRLDYAAAGELATDEEKMEIIAHRRAEACAPEFKADVLIRKLTIARGNGFAHGKSYTMAEYGLTANQATLA